MRAMEARSLCSPSLYVDGAAKHNHVTHAKDVRQQPHSLRVSSSLSSPRVNLRKGSTSLPANDSLGAFSHGGESTEIVRKPVMVRMLTAKPRFASSPDGHVARAASSVSPPPSTSLPEMIKEITFSRSRREYREVSQNFMDEVVEMASKELQEFLPEVIPPEGKLLETVQFLLSLWISKKSAVAIIKDCPELLNADVRSLTERVEFFQDLGCTPGEIGAAFKRNFGILLFPVEKIERTMAYVESTGVPSEKVPNILLKSPGVFDLNPEKSLEPLITCLSDMVALEGGVERMIERSPMLLELSDRDVMERTSVMSLFGMTMDAIATLVYMRPQVLRFPPDVLMERFKNLQRIFSPRRLPNIFKVAPSCITTDSARISKQKDLICDYLGEEIGLKVINAFPQALSLSWERVLLPKFEYLQQLGLDPSEVVNFPAYLGYSLPDRIKPRCEALLAQGYTIDAHARVISSESAIKLRKFGRSHKEILETEGKHAVAIQHIVGLTAEDFEAQFGLGLTRVLSAYDRRGMDMEVEESELEGMEELTEELLEEIGG